MKQSWSTILFLRINMLVGRWRLIDFLLVFCAHYLIGVLALLLILTWTVEGTVFVKSIRLGSELVAALGISYAFAFLWKRPRPIKQLPDIKVLIKTLGTWKSFPSDHTIFASIIGYNAIGAYGTLGLVVFLLACASVAFARIWVGVHYPRDILGGLAIALFVIALFSYSVG